MSMTTFFQNKSGESKTKSFKNEVLRSGGILILSGGWSNLTKNLCLEAPEGQSARGQDLRGSLFSLSVAVSHRLEHGPRLSTKRSGLGHGKQNY